LEWVYRTRDSRQDYYVLPVADVEERPEAFSMDAVSQAACSTFVADSRALFRKHNKNVGELNSPALYYVHFQATDTLAIGRYLSEYGGVSVFEIDDAGTIHVGPMTEPDARHLYQRIYRDLPVESLSVSRRN